MALEPLGFLRVRAPSLPITHTQGASFRPVIDKPAPEHSSRGTQTTSKHANPQVENQTLKRPGRRVRQAVRWLLGFVHSVAKFPG